MKLFLALVLLSGSCLYGMEDNNNNRNQLKKSQELPKDYSFYSDWPGAALTVVYKNDFYKEGIHIKLSSLGTSQSLVPSQQLVGAIVTITKKSTHE